MLLTRRLERIMSGAWFHPAMTPNQDLNLRSEFHPTREWSVVSLYCYFLVPPGPVGGVMADLLKPL